MKSLKISDDKKHRPKEPHAGQSVSCAPIFSSMSKAGYILCHSIELSGGDRNERRDLNLSLLAIERTGLSSVAPFFCAKSYTGIHYAFAGIASS